MKYAVKLSVRYRTLWVVSLYRYPHNNTDAVEWYMGRGRPVHRFATHGFVEDPKAFGRLVRLRFRRGYVTYGDHK